jgi:hypothetical protein
MNKSKVKRRKQKQIGGGREVVAATFAFCLFIFAFD